MLEPHCEKEDCEADAVFKTHLDQLPRDHRVVHYASLTESVTSTIRSFPMQSSHIESSYLILVCTSASDGGFGTGLGLYWLSLVVQRRHRLVVKKSRVDPIMSL